MESLENNTHAENTDVYISVDYPPSQKYFDGNKKVIEYLKSKEHDHKFKKLMVFYQKSNLGPINNNLYLKAMVKKDGYDRYISSEDDNVFAPAFLDFCNKGLELCEANPRMMNVCGHRDIRIKDPESELYYRPSFTYGSGYLFSKTELLRELIHFDYFETIMRSPLKMIKLARWDRSAFECLVWGLIVTRPKCFYIDNDISMIDYVLEVFCWDHNYISINPTYNLVSNRGYDGSGLNCTSEGIEEYPLFAEKEFPYGKVSDCSSQSINNKLNMKKKIQYCYFVYRYILWLCFDRKLKRKPA